MNINIKDENFWEELWEKNRRTSSSKKGAGGYQEYPVEKWNQRAASFAKQNDGGAKSRRWISVKEFLKKSGFEITPKMRILDIGAGPGNFALPFAEMGAQVWALDPAENMINILKKEITKKNIVNIQTFTEKWEDINLQKMGWDKHFDFVFASMSPGINNRDTIQKMIYASKGFCYISSFAGPREYPLQEIIAKEILGEDYKTYTPDIIYPFNLLYAMGYFPNLFFDSSQSEREVDLDDIYDEIISHIAMYTQITIEIHTRVKNYLEENKSSENRIIKRTSSRVGMLLWKV